MYVLYGCCVPYSIKLELLHKYLHLTYPLNWLSICVWLNLRRSSLDNIVFIQWLALAVLYYTTINFFEAVTFSGWLTTSPKSNIFILLTLLTLTNAKYRFISQLTCLTSLLYLNLIFAVAPTLIIYTDLRLLINPLLTNPLNQIHPLLTYTFHIYTALVTFPAITLRDVKAPYSWKLRILLPIVLLGITSTLLGMFWAEQLESWSGWWVWDPSEILILLTTVLVLKLLHSWRVKKYFGTVKFLYTKYTLFIAIYWVYTFNYLNTTLHSFTGVDLFFYKSWLVSITLVWVISVVITQIKLYLNYNATSASLFNTTFFIWVLGLLYLITPFLRYAVLLTTLFWFWFAYLRKVTRVWRLHTFIYGTLLILATQYLPPLYLIQNSHNPPYVVDLETTLNNFDTYIRYLNNLVLEYSTLIIYTGGAQKDLRWVTLLNQITLV